MQRSRMLATIISFLAAVSLWAEPNGRADAHWSVQVENIEPGDVNIDPAFRFAIYENLVKELTKTKQFRQVLRDGDRNASGVGDLLVLKSKIESYTPGSETKRAVTTVAGATKLKLLAQLRTQDGRIVLERSVNGTVRFFGGNLRATHNLAHNVAGAIKKSTLPNSATSSGGE